MEVQLGPQVKCKQDKRLGGAPRGKNVIPGGAPRLRNALYTACVY